MLELPKYDLPTLHRPVDVEDVREIYQKSNPTRILHPIATPPHKQGQLDYGHRPYTSSELLHSRPRTSSGSTLPSILTETQWRTRRAKQQFSDDLPDSSEYEESYNDLTTRTAYRYPHPGVPKGREGCMGGTWRHTKEAIGYGPGRLMWIDGVVTLYDDWTINHEKPWSGKKFTVAPSRDNPPSLSVPPFIPRRVNQVQTSYSNKWYSSNIPQPLPVSDTPCGIGKPGDKYKGFYSMAQSYS
ncbi:hypothetical protein EB796_008790 [Bugula neritina]|uniref:Uncharacterized protein n=1 Tax=Bugula neritina TaxID=10212 RepID=A0A7J7K401_BUGNE|nr:hypothetical protein EB796_008790 [Bugula neritina]